jgi:virulence-associated protein VagC
MKLKVTEKGVLIPRELLGESQFVEVTQEQEKIIITTIKKTSSIWELGTNPVECDVKDAAIKHDYYLYNQ